MRTHYCMALKDVENGLGFIHTYWGMSRIYTFCSSYLGLMAGTKPNALHMFGNGLTLNQILIPSPMFQLLVSSTTKIARNTHFLRIIQAP